MKPTIAVAVSGGVDSLVSAYLLQQAGYRVFGLHFLTGFESGPPAIHEMSAQIDLAVEVIDIQDEFKNMVIDYFARTYAACRTPNPCLVCNPNIKFGILLDIARQKGADRLATGHYARVHEDNQGRCHLLKGKDPEKDQAYFLAFLNQQQLSRACFPLGGYTKKKVRTLASINGLEPASSEESQDVCFIKGSDYSEFLTCRLGLDSPPGEIVDEAGTVLGQHKGLHRFTIGQRRGINCPSSEPYYVLRIDRRANRLVVGRKKQLLTDACRVEHTNWIQPPVLDAVHVHVKVRYRHSAVPATVYPMPDGRAEVRFDRPETAVTPGQGAVFYDGDEVLGGGFIV